MTRWCRDSFVLFGWIVLSSFLLPGAAYPQKVQIREKDRNPWSHLEFPERPRDVHFAIVADNSAVPRPGVFAGAIDALRRLRPDFVLSVGDFVRGFTHEGRVDDLDQMASDWGEVEGAIATLDVPFFWVPGNNDLNSDGARRLWEERFGRSWFSFVFEDCLFVGLDSDDPPGSDLGRIGPQQLQWLEGVLRRNRDVRWTFVFLHRPLWVDDQAQWIPVERLLTGRKRTVFAGHHHVFSHVTVDGNDYFTLATTGGLSRLRGAADGTFDHVTWVAVPPQGEPRISQLMLEGLFGPDPVAESRAATAP